DRLPLIGGRRRRDALRSGLRQAAEEKKNPDPAHKDDGAERVAGPVFMLDAVHGELSSAIPNPVKSLMRMDFCEMSSPGDKPRSRFTMQPCPSNLASKWANELA